MDDLDEVFAVVEGLQDKDVRKRGEGIPDGALVLVGVGYVGEDHVAAAFLFFHEVGQKARGNYAGLEQVVGLILPRDDVQEGVEEVVGQVVFCGCGAEVPFEAGYAGFVPEGVPGVDAGFLVFGGLQEEAGDGAVGVDQALCLEGIEGDIFVVDNDSSDGTVATLQPKHPQVIL